MAILKEVGDKMIKHIDRMQNETINSLYEYNQRTGMLDKAANNGDLNAEFLQLLKHQYEKKSGAQPLPKTIDVIFKNYPDL